MNDIQLLYPIAADLAMTSEKTEPQLHNYFALGGKQVFFRKFKKEFQTLTRSWISEQTPQSRVCDVLPGQLRLVMSSSDFYCAKSSFRDLCAELLTRSSGELF